MSEGRKKSHVWHWTAALLVAVLVAYPLSWGPVGFLLTHNKLPAWMLEPIITFYTPVLTAIINAPAWMQPALDWYMNFWRWLLGG
jgi:hypothetical protein